MKIFKIPQILRGNVFIVLYTLIAIIVLVIYIPFVHYTDNTKVALIKNIFTNEIVIDSIPGITFSAPWYKVVRIPIHPCKVCVESTAKTINCKLVKFQPAYWEELVRREGFEYYWWRNRFSFNLGYRNEYRGCLDILRGYAFSQDNVNFITTN